MHRRRLLIAAIAAVMIVSLPIPAMAIGRTPKQIKFVLQAQLLGTNETPSGDSNGFGFANITIDRVTSEVCYRISVAQIGTATASHIHRGTAGTNGPVVVPFTAPNGDGFANGCVAGDPAVVAEILTNPSGFYVNVHTTDYPPGAVRGQLKHLGS